MKPSQAFRPGEIKTSADLDLSLNFVLDQILTLDQLMVSIIHHFEAKAKGDKDGLNQNIETLMAIVRKFKNAPNVGGLEKKRADFIVEFGKAVEQMTGNVLRTEERLVEVLGGQYILNGEKQVLNHLANILDQIFNREEDMFDGNYDEARIRAEFYEYIPTDYYWDRSTFPNDHKYIHMEVEDFAKERNNIFQEMIVALDAHLKILGKENKALSDEETWILAAYMEPEIAVLLERYNELESARFMKFYGATRVPPMLFT